MTPVAFHAQGSVISELHYCVPEMSASKKKLRNFSVVLKIQ